MMAIAYWGANTEPGDGGRARDAVIDTMRGIAILMVTAFGDVDGAVKSLQDGADDFIQKPFSMDDLSKKLREVLDA